MRDVSAQPNIHLRVDAARIDHPVDEPHRRAVGEALELRDAERRSLLQLVQHERMCQPGWTVECAQRPRELSLPTVRGRDALSARAVVCCKRRRRTEALALARRGLERPRQLRKRSLTRPPRDVAGVERAARVLPERARLATRAVVGHRLAHEVDAAGCARAGRVKQIAVARHLVARSKPRAPGRVELAP